MHLCRCSSLEYRQMSDDEAFEFIAGVVALVKLSKAEIARREKEGRFPQRIPLGPFKTSRRVFLRTEVRAWMREQIEAARGTDVPSR